MFYVNNFAIEVCGTLATKLKSIQIIIICIDFFIVNARAKILETNMKC